MASDVRKQIFKKIKANKVHAVLKCCSTGVLAGMDELCGKATEMGLKVMSALKDGSEVKEGDTIAVLEGNPIGMAIAEDTLVGLVAKPSGVATAARKAAKLANGRVNVVCGAWKKVPPSVRELLRKAALTGGIRVRISDRPFVYLDKNYVRMFGSVKDALDAVSLIRDRIKVVQVRGDAEEIARETAEAVDGNADIIFVDTGRIRDVRAVLGVIEKSNVRRKVEIAFGGNVRISDIRKLAKEDLDILEIGREIVDAPILDLRFEVESAR